MGQMTQMGIGFVLDFTDKTSDAARNAAKEVHRLRGEVEGLSASFNTQIDNIEKQMKRGKEIMGWGIKGMAAGAAIMTPVVIATNAAMKDQDTWYNVVTQDIYKLGAAKDDAVAAMRREQEMVKKLTHEQTPIPAEAAEGAWIRLRGLMKDTVAATVLFQESMKAAAVTGADPTATVEAANILNNLTKSEFAHMDAQQKAIRIAEMLTRANRQYGAGVADIADGLKMVMNEANLANPRISELFAMITPLTASGMNARMAGSAVGGFFTGIAKFDADVKVKMKALSKQPQSYAEMQQLEEARKTISPELRKLIGVSRTDSSGAFRNPLDIIADWEKAFGLSAERSAQVEADIKAGKISEQDRFKALGLTGAQQQALMDTGVTGIGHWFGRSDELKQTAGLFETDGKLEDAFAALDDVASTEKKKMLSAFEDLTEELGSTLLPTVQDLSKKLRELIDDVSAFATKHPTMTENAMKAAAGTSLAITGASFGLAAYGGGLWATNKLNKMRVERAELAAKKAAATAANQAAEQIDTATKEVAEQTTKNADEFFSEFAPKLETAIKPLEAAAKPQGWIKRFGGGFLKSGAKAGLGAISLLPLLPWDAEASGLSSLSEQAPGFDMSILPNLITTGMYNPIRDQRLSTVMGNRDRDNDTTAVLERLFDSSTIKSSRTGQDADGRIIYQSNYFEFREATEDSALKAAEIIDQRSRDKADRAVGAQH